MDKLHTHYDNLKIARLAPPEVIRAAYKALTQKYHPDKNPGDERAARIMAILNSAYNTLSDDQLRKEHDAWIAAEEWEIAWLESTRQEESAAVNLMAAPSGAANGRTGLAIYRPSRDPKWWLILALCVGLGWLAAVLSRSNPFAETVANVGMAQARAGALEESGDKNTPAPASGKAAENKVVVLSQVVLPESSTRCGSAAETSLLAPNGESWPAHSAYLDGYRVGNAGGYTELTIDNSNNPVPVYIKLFDVEKGQNVRHLYIGIRDKFVMENLVAGNYEIRRQDLGPAGNAGSCNKHRARR